MQLRVWPVIIKHAFGRGMLAELDRALEARGVELQFAEMKDPVKDKMKRFELFQHMGEKAFHPTVGAAVDAYLEDTGVDWQP
jgi:MFS superfamily sulfate permease-like transporter